jgi:hypothetical protein
VARASHRGRLHWWIRGRFLRSLPRLTRRQGAAHLLSARRANLVGTPAALSESQTSSGNAEIPPVIALPRCVIGRTAVMTAAATAQQCSGPQNCRAINKSTAEPKRLGSGTSPVNNPSPGRSRAERWVPVAPDRSRGNQRVTWARESGATDGPLPRESSSASSRPFQSHIVGPRYDHGREYREAGSARRARARAFR